MFPRTSDVPSLAVAFVSGLSLGYNLQCFLQGSVETSIPDF